MPLQDAIAVGRRVFREGAKGPAREPEWAVATGCKLHIWNRLPSRCPRRKSPRLWYNELQLRKPLSPRKFNSLKSIWVRMNRTSPNGLILRSPRS